MSPTAIIGIVCTVLGAVIGYLGFFKTAKKESKDEGKENGALMVELGYIKSGIDDIKTEQKEQRKINSEFVTRLTAVEESAKQAHKRLDRWEAHNE